MKQITVVYNVVLESRVLECLHSCGIDAYTKYPKAYGIGHSSEPHMGTHIWPGENRVIFSVVDDEKIPDIVQKIRELKQKYPREGLKLIVTPVEQVV
jgi:nitrogen regulatory protein PII